MSAVRYRGGYVSALLTLFTGRRKIGCTKEPNGCLSCNQLGIKCSHSDQKQMGRPRKFAAANTRPQEAFQQDLKPAEEPSQSNNKFISQHQNSSYPTHNLDTSASQDVSPLNIGPTSIMGRIDFDVYKTPPPQPQAQPVHEEEWARSIPSDTVTSEGSLAVANEEALSNFTRPSVARVTEQNPGNCSCITAILSSLDSISSFFSADVDEAMRLARAASMVVREVMFCPSCGLLRERSTLPNIATSRNVYFVCILVPTIVKLFMKVLDMVDTEVASAQMEKRNLDFDVRRLGGLSGALQRAHSHCEESRKTLSSDPDHWRVMMRVLLRADIYGYRPSEDKHDPRDPDLYLGLWEIILGFEKMFHEQSDELKVSDQHDSSRYHAISPKEHADFLLVLNIAKDALSSLVIP